MCIRDRITYPRTNTPLIVSLYPSILTFTSSNWNTPQSIILSASGDSIDNDIDVESFQVLYYVKTSDTIFVSKATNSHTNIAATLNGAIAGLVAITAEPLTPSMGQAVIIGAIGGIICMYGMKLLDMLKIDDVVGAILSSSF
mgnify:CR=1 FL=1